MVIRGDAYLTTYIEYNKTSINPSYESEAAEVNTKLTLLVDDIELKVNLLDPSAATDGGYYNNGVWQADATLYSSDFIEVNEGSTYYINPVYAQRACYWDASRQFIMRSPSNAHEFTVPKIGAIKYMTVFGLLANKNIDMIVRDTSYPNYYVAYGHPSSNMDTDKNSDVDVIMLGDSITWYDGHVLPGPNVPAVGYPSYLKQLGFKSVTNAAVSGACIAYHSDSPYVDIVTTANSTNFATYDIVTIAGGINDFKFWDSPIGQLQTLGFDDTTVIGALQIIIEKIFSDNINAKIALFTPLKAAGWNTPNGLGLTLMDYRDAIISVAEYYSIPVFDMTQISGFNNITIASYTIDGLHPNNDGFKLVCVDKMKSFVNAL